MFGKAAVTLDTGEQLHRRLAPSAGWQIQYAGAGGSAVGLHFKALWLAQPPVGIATVKDSVSGGVAGATGMGLRRCYGIAQMGSFPMFGVAAQLGAAAMWQRGGRKKCQADVYYCRHACSGRLPKRKPPDGKAWTARKIEALAARG